MQIRTALLQHYAFLKRHTSIIRIAVDRFRLLPSGTLNLTQCVSYNLRYGIVRIKYWLINLSETCRSEYV